MVVVYKNGAFPHKDLRVSLTRRTVSSSHHGDRSRGAENPDPSEDGSPAGEAPGQKGESWIAQQLALGDRKSGGAFVTDLRAPLNTFLERFSLERFKHGNRGNQHWAPSMCAGLLFPDGVSQESTRMSSSMATGPEDSPPASYSLQDNGNLFPGREQARRARGFGKPGSDLASSIF